MKEVRGRDYLTSLPYDSFRVNPDCGHSPSYVLRNYEEQPLFCGLCFYREGWESELPGRVHLFKTLAENGNPETSPKFLAHLFLAVGLEAPKPDETLREFQNRRSPRAREQYTRPAWGLFPVASTLWKLMGYQPPLAIVLVRGTMGQSEAYIANAMDISLLDVYIRMAKGIRAAMGFLPYDTRRSDKDRPTESNTESAA